jgi:DNA-binding CsgD family transcriptional regulator
MARQQQGGEGMTRHGIHLTDRQMDILRRSARGQGAGRIADELHIGKDRVKKIKQDIKAALGMNIDSDTDEMLTRARNLGFIQ